MRDSDRARHTLGRALTVLRATFAVALLFGCMPYELRTVLDGPEGKALSVSPSATVLPTLNSISFSAVGGVGPYVYAVVSGPGTGSIDSAGVYTAPLAACSAIIRVTDKTGKSVDAAVTVQALAPSGVDYAVPTTTFLATGTAGTAIAGGQTFQLASVGTATGATSVDWKVYLSVNTVLDGGDTLIASGSVPAVPFATSVPVILTGTFPSVAAGTYYLIVTVSSVEDTNLVNNTSAASALAMLAKNINYVVNPVSSTGGTTAGAAMTGDFTIQNIGTADGSATIFWQVRASPDPIFDATDYIVAGGSIPGGLPKGPPATTIPVSGTWPSTPGTWYLFAVAVAVDDIDNSNNVSTPTLVSTTGVAPANVEYRVDGVSNSAGMVAGDPISGTFTYHNFGTSGGAQQVYWTAYLSSDAILQVGTDTVIDSGTVGPLGPPTPITGSVPFTGTWPSIPGPWYLIVSISASDDVIPTNNVTASALITTTVPSVNYTALGVTSTGGTIAGGPLAGNVTIKNVGTHAGNQFVPWRVYVSTNPTLGMAPDTLVASGSIAFPGLGVGASVNPTFSGTWPNSGTSQSYFLIVEVAAGDDVDSTNNVGASASAIPVTGVAPAYTITAVPAPVGLITGQLVNGTFTVQNVGNATSGALVYYQIYASLGNGTYDAGDTLIASGSFGGLAPSNSTSPSYTGTWPATSGLYQIIVRASAADSALVPDAPSASVVVSLPPSPDYTVDVPSAVLPATGTVNALLSAAPGGPYHFSIRNTSANTGTQQIYWRVYASSDAILDASDTLLAAGSIGFLAGSSTSLPINFDGTWPVTGAYYRLIITANAGDDANPSNNNLISGPVEVPNVAAEVESNDGVGPYPGSLASANDLGSLALNQLVKVTGTTDGKNKYDTFKINVAAGATSLELKAIWSTGADDIDLYVWDTTGLTGPSVLTTPNIEQVTWIIAPGVWYIGVKQITNPPASGYAYSLYIRPLP